MSNPFKDTILYTTIVLHPSQLNNNIYSNIKQNLMSLVGMCYKKYGYISKIYEILEHDSGCIRPEDPTSSVEYKIKFSCRLCHPIENMQIICKINKITSVFVSLIREPIYITVPLSNCNEDIFVWDAHKKHFIIKKTGEILESDTFVKATILSKTFTNKDKSIFAIGYLNDIATDDEINKFYNDEYASKEKPVEFSDFENEIVKINDYEQNFVQQETNQSKKTENIKKESIKKKSVESDTSDISLSSDSDE
jgi:DNA-directed RNA polymerase subunit E'/Rpb7